MILFVWLIRAAVFAVSQVLLSSRFRALQKEGGIRGSEEVQIPLFCNMKATVMGRGLLANIRDCKVNQVLVLWPMHKQTRSIGQTQKLQAGTCTILLRQWWFAVSKWEVNGSKKGQRGNALLSVVHPKVVPKHVVKL